MSIAFEVKDVNVIYRSIQKTTVRNLLKRDREVDYVKALQDVSFSMERGEVMGVIGRNGSGKSTLLRTIAGIFSPDSGVIDLKGNSCCLLAIGTGFIPELSGRENIMLSGLLMGFEKEKIREKEEQIIEYFGKREFIDYPVRTYSSGMYSRLAFSISANLEPDILLIDELLSVGDEEFKAKSMETISRLITDEERTVMIVTHNLEQMASTCNRIMWMEAGRIRAIGSSKEIIEQYHQFNKARSRPPQTR